jgi:hypothetical protein
MKSIRVLTCALVACGISASAASIEQILDITVMGWYDGPITTSGVTVHARVVPIQIHSDNIVRALATDRDTNFFRGTLFFKTALDGSTTNIVIRVGNKTNELDVTDAFNFTPTFAVTDVVLRDNTFPPTTNSVVETGLKGLSFTSSSIGFTNIGFSTGTATRSRLIAGNAGAGVVSGYTFQHSFSGGSGSFFLNTNKFFTTNFTFAATNFVDGPAQISFKTFSPVFRKD